MSEQEIAAEFGIANPTPSEGLLICALHIERAKLVRVRKELEMIDFAVKEARARSFDGDTNGAIIDQITRSQTQIEVGDRVLVVEGVQPVAIKGPWRGTVTAISIGEYTVKVDACYEMPAGWSSEKEICLRIGDTVRKIT